MDSGRTAETTNRVFGLSGAGWDRSVSASLAAEFKQRKCFIRVTPLTNAPDAREELQDT